MKMFRRKKDKQEEEADLAADNGTQGGDDTDLTRDEEAEASQAVASVEAGVSGEAKVEEGADSEGSEGADDSPSEREDVEAGRKDESDFFDLPPDKVAGYMPRGQVVAAPRHIDFRPVLKILAVVAGVAAFVFFIYLIWPTSVARVPDLVGKELTDAMDTARSRGFAPAVKSWRYSEGHSDGVVLSQSPASASVVEKGSKISLIVSKGPRPEQGTKPRITTTVPQAPVASGPYAGKVICVDAGGQSRPDLGEWTDPGMTRKNTPEPEIRGATTGNAEYLVNMDIAMKLKSLLEKDGMTVIMTREKNDVDISNAMRAEMANNANANLYMRIHCAWSEDPFKKGTQTLYPAQNRWTEPIYLKSKEAALLVQSELLKSCGTEDLGVVPIEDIAGFNWSRVPVIQPEPGYLSSPRDDTLLAEDNYRWKIAWGLRNGIIKFLTNP